MVLATLILFLCLMPLVLVYAAFTVVVSRLTRYGSTTSFAELSAHERQKMDLAMTATPIIPTILVGYFWHSRFCYDLLMAPLVLPYQEILRWVWFIAMMMFVFMITRLERKTRRAVVNRTIAEGGKGQGITDTGNSTQPEET